MLSANWRGFDRLFFRNETTQRPEDFPVRTGESECIEIGERSPFRIRRSVSGRLDTDQISFQRDSIACDGVLDGSKPRQCRSPYSAIFRSITLPPTVGDVGAVRWTFAGTLAPGSSDSVTYGVTVKQY